MRFSGIVGYASSFSEEAPGVHVPVITERTYYGDVIRNARRLESSSSAVPTLNDNITVENSISILADAYAYDNFKNMRYVSWNGSNWTVTNVEVRRPRLILTLGGLWNGNTA
jgi:hypothetical protein